MKKIILIPFLFLFLQAQSIAEIVPLMSLDSLTDRVKEFSGEVSTTIAGSSVNITNRVSNNGNNLAAEYLYEKMLSYGYDVVKQDYSTSGRNVLATKLGVKSADSVVIVCAHYDSEADYCADDNASSCAAILESARLLKDHLFNYTILFAFWDEEELGKLGSYYYAEQASLSGMKIKGVMNVEMIGYDSDDDGVFDIHTSDLNNSTELSNALFQMVNEYQLNLSPLIFNPGTDASDHKPFWDYGYPAIVFSESFFGGDGNPAYHTSNDRINLFNFDYFYELSKLVLVGTASFAELTYESSNQQLAGCDSLSVHGSFYYSSTDVIDTLSNRFNHDSIVHSSIEINNANFTWDYLTSCDSLLWKDGKVYYESNNTAKYLDQNVKGCDSIILLDVEIIKIPDVIIQNDNGVLSSNYLVADQYEWFWCDNGELTEISINNAYFEPDFNGEFALQVNSGGCVKSSGCFEFLWAGIKQNELNELSIFPNPNNGRFSINTYEFPIELIKIYDSKGVLYHEQGPLLSNEVTLDLPQGFYVLELWRNGVRKIIKWQLK